MGQSHDGEQDDGNEQRGDGGDHHVADVGEEWSIRNRRCQDRRVRQGRDLVAEVGSRDDGSGYPAFVEALCLTDAHQGDADGGDGRPRAARHHRHEGADEAGRGQEEVGMDNLHPIIY